MSSFFHSSYFAAYAVDQEAGSELYYSLSITHLYLRKGLVCPVLNTHRKAPSFQYPCHLPYSIYNSWHRFGAMKETVIFVRG